MQIKLNEEQIDEVMFTGLLRLEESFPNDKKLSKAIKRVLSYTMIPSDWETIYDRDWEKYVECQPGSNIMFGAKSEYAHEYDNGSPEYEYDSTMDSYSPEYTFSITPSPEEVKIEKSRKGNK